MERNAECAVGFPLWRILHFPPTNSTCLISCESGQVVLTSVDPPKTPVLATQETRKNGSLLSVECGAGRDAPAMHMTFGWYSLFT
jgi:hypothetical protein